MKYFIVLPNQLFENIETIKNIINNNDNENGIKNINNDNKNDNYLTIILYEHPLYF